MRGYFSSHRRRRRTAWTAGLLILAGGIVFVGVEWPNTGRSYETPISAGPPAPAYQSPRSVPFPAKEQVEVRAVASQFVATAVLRPHVEQSWALSSPELRRG